MINNLFLDNPNSNYNFDQDKSDSTVFLGIGGFIVASCLLIAAALLIYKRFRKPSAGSTELINEGTSFVLILQTILVINR